MIKNRERVNLLFHPDDERNLIFQQWLNRDEAINSQVVFTTNNIELQTQFAIVNKNWILSDFLPQNMMFTHFNANFTRIDEIVPSIYKLSISNNKKFVFSQFLILDERPMLIHTGRSNWFEQTYQLVSSVCDPSKLHYIALCHLEADECGALNQWLEAAPKAKTIVSPLNQSNMDDFALRPTTVLKNNKALSLGKRDIILIETPHFPHGWEGCVFYQPQEEILFCSDLAAHPGQFEEPVTEKDLTESIIKFQQKLGFMSEGKSFTRGIEAIEKLPIKYLATMHGSIIHGESISKLLSKMKRTFGS